MLFYHNCTEDAVLRGDDVVCGQHLSSYWRLLLRDVLGLIVHAVHRTSSANSECAKEFERGSSQILDSKRENLDWQGLFPLPKYGSVVKLSNRVVGTRIDLTGGSSSKPRLLGALDRLYAFDLHKHFENSGCGLGRSGAPGL